MAKKPKGAPEVLPIATLQPEDAGTAAALGSQYAGAVGAEKAYQESSFLDKSQAAWRQSGLASLAAAALTRPDFDDDPKWVAPVEELQGYSEDELDQLWDARSRQEFEYEKSMIQWQREDNEELAKSGLAVAFGASLVAGLPEGILTGRAFSAPFVAAARAKGIDNALRASLAGNIGGNVAAIGVEDALSERVSIEDYGMGTLFGLIGTGLEMPSILRGAKGQALLAKAAEDSAARRVAAEQKALDNLGPHATPEQVAAEATRIETLDLMETQRAAQAPLGADRRLLPDMEKLAADEAASEADVGPVQANSIDPIYDRSGILEDREFMARTDPDWKQSIRRVTDNEFDYDNAVLLPEGVHTSKAAAADVRLRPAVDAIRALAEEFMPGKRIIVGSGSNNPKAQGEIISAGKVHFIGIVPDSAPTLRVRTAVHEVGHAVFHEYARNIPRELLARMRADHRAFLDDLNAGRIDDAVNRRFSVTNDSRDAEAGKLTEQVSQKYIHSFDEYTAEQFTKFIEKRVSDGEAKLPRNVLTMIKDAINTALMFFRSAKRQGFLDPDDSFAEFFQGVLDGTYRQSVATKAPQYLDTSLTIPSDFNAAVTKGPDLSFLQHPVAVKHGLHMLPVDTPTRRAEARAIIELYKKAEDPKAPWNNIDKKRLDNILKHTPSLGSTGLQLLRSENPVARMVASELLETTTGAAGRRSNAALAKYLTERKAMGNIINEVQAAYREYRNAAGGSVLEDYTKGKLWERFNRAVAEEIEARRQPGDRPDVNPAVKTAADKVEAAFERLRKMQVESRTTGWAALPETSVGYLPHKLSPAKVRQLTVKQMEQLHTTLVDQFVTVDGWDISFSANLASKYIERVRKRALGGYTSDMGRHSVGAADIVEDALKAMGMAPDEVRANMQKYMRGAAGHTKKRIDLDLLREYTDDDGKAYKLIDMFDTDVLGLVRAQARRVSGEVALARHGVMGKAGLQVLRQAMEFGAEGHRAQLNEFEAFDQVAAEFLGEPFGNYGGKWMNRAMQMNSLVRLGGMGFTQAAETLNAAAHLGFMRAAAVVGSFGRLRKECVKLAKGEKVDSILSSIETYGGAEFGTDAYKMVFPYEHPDLQYAVHGVDTAHVADRLLSGGTQLQGKLSFWRAIHSAQQRGVAEQIVLKALRYIRDGGEDVALADMGFTPETVKALRADLPNIVKFDANGRVVEFDITKTQNQQAADEFVQAVHRGTFQIIQGTFIGETGKWAHEGYLKLLTQFRTFSLTSVEKQWSRNKANHGLARAVGILMGSMVAAAPIYMTRVYVNSVGREDQDEYLAQRLAPEVIARATLNYVAMSGLAPDFIDALAGVAGVSTTGGRIGTGSEFVGSVVAPAAGLLDDMYKAVQNTREGTDLHGTIQNMPLAKLPYLQPVINMLDTE